MIELLAAVALSVQPFKYEREIRLRADGVATVVADPAMLAHARPDFADVRIADAQGRQVPWRPQPTLPASARTVSLLDVGRRDGAAVARFRNRGVIDSIVLDLPGQDRKSVV